MGRSLIRVATATVSVDVVLLGCHARRWHAIVDTAASRPSLPCGAPGRNESLDDAAARIARQASSVVPQWIEQVGAFRDASSHPVSATLSIGYVGVLPFASATSWKPIDALTALPERHRRMLADSVRALQRRLDQAPLAFSLLPDAFTLSELQQTYETLLGRRLHKASFRRALHSAFLVAPTGDMRSEGRGRPAQLYRYAPRRRRQRRNVRFDLLQPGTPARFRRTER